MRVVAIPQVAMAQFGPRNEHVPETPLSRFLPRPQEGVQQSDGTFEGRLRGRRARIGERETPAELLGRLARRLGRAARPCQRTG